MTFSTLDTPFEIFDNKTNLTGCGHYKQVGSSEFVCLRNAHEGDPTHYYVAAPRY